MTETTEMPNETYDWDATRDRLRKRLDEGHPPAWMHGGEIGAELVGHVVGVKAGVPTQFGPCPVVTIATLGVGTQVSLWLTHTVLRREFVRQRPEPGELIALRYEGERKPDGGGPAYELYSLVVDRPDEVSVDWTAIAARYDLQVEGDEHAQHARPELDMHVDDDEDIPF
jgi:hypothetical protein